jgi:hypothetical protein
MGISGTIGWLLIHVTLFNWSSVEKMTIGTSAVKNLEGPICHTVKTQILNYQNYNLNSHRTRTQGGNEAISQLTKKKKKPSFLTSQFKVSFQMPEYLG